MLGIFLRGFAIGLSIAAPVGPIGVLCIRRTLADGRRVGLATGLGAATADAAYGAVAGFGLAALSRLLVEQAGWLQPVGGAFLCYLGLRTLLARPATTPAQVVRAGLVGAYASTLALTLANPLTIVSFAAVFAGLGLSAAASYQAASVMVGGVFLGSAAWWLFLSTVVGFLRDRATPAGLVWVNRISGSVILAFGGVALAAGLR